MKMLRFYSILLLVLSFSSLAAETQEDKKDVSIYIDVVDSNIGPQMGLGQCPCFRIATQHKVLGGEIETKYVLVKSEGLLTMEMDRGLNFRTADSLTKRLFNLGATELMWKGQVLGVYFPGVTLGNDLDRGYTDIIRTGMHLVLKAYRSRYAQVDFRIGYSHDQGNINLFRDYNDHIWHNSFNAVINKGRHRFGFKLAYELIPANQWRSFVENYRAYSQVFYSIDFFRTKYIDFYLGTSLNGEIDKHRQFGHDLAPYNLTMQLFVGGRFHVKTRTQRKAAKQNAKRK